MLIRLLTDKAFATNWFSLDLAIYLLLQKGISLTKVEKYAQEHLPAEIKEIETSPRNTEALELTIFEKAILYKYSTDGYNEPNEELRKSNGKQNTAFGKLVSSCLSKLTDFEGLVYRKVTLTAAELKRYRRALRENLPIVEYSFISSSKSRLIAMRFAGDTLFRIYSRTGKDIEKIAKFGAFSSENEKEVLFRENRRFRVLGITKEATYTLITMEEII